MEFKKRDFTCYKSPALLSDVYIKKVSGSNKITSAKKINKHFIGYLYNDHKVKPLNMLLPKTSTYGKSYDGETIWMYNLIEDDDLLKKYNTVWNKVSVDISKEFHRERVYNKKNLKTKIISWWFCYRF